MKRPRKHASNVAVIDIGSNSVRLVVYEAMARSLITIFNEKALCGLGREVQTIVIVTHNMAQARRASDECIFMLLGEMMEHSRTEDLFIAPRHPKTAEYIEGQYG